jgi:hypothetical protein
MTPQPIRRQGLFAMPKLTKPRDASWVGTGSIVLLLKINSYKLLRTRSNSYICRSFTLCMYVRTYSHVYRSMCVR